MPSSGYGTGPNTSTVADIANRGLAAIQDRQKAMSFNSTQQREALNWLAQQGTGRTYNPMGRGDVYSAWFDSMNNAPTATNGKGGYVYGQTSKGAYAGYKNESDLKSAIAGAASMQRGSTNALLTQLAQHAQQNLDSIQQQHDTAIHDASAKWAAQAYHNPNAYDAAAGTGPAAPDKYTVGLTPVAMPGTDGATQGQVAGAVQDWARGMWSHHPTTAGADTAGYGAQQDAYMQQLSRQANHADDYQKQLDEWYATQADKQLSGQEFATQAMQAPITAYERQAAAQYGVDPNLAAGWFGDQQALTDWRTQRDMQSLQDTGMPYSEWTSYLDSLQSDQAKAQTAAEKQAATQQEAQINADVLDATGGYDAQQLAQSANVAPEVVWTIATSDQFKAARDELATALDAANSGQATVSDIEGAVSKAYDIAMSTGTGDAMLSILQQMYPKAFNAYEQAIYSGQNAVG